MEEGAKKKLSKFYMEDCEVCDVESMDGSVEEMEVLFAFSAY